MKTFYRILFLFTFLAQTNLFAQMEKAQTALQNSPYVINGLVLDFSFLKDKEQHDFISYKINVKQCLKGDAYLTDGDTVEVVMPLPSRMQLFEDGYGVSHEQIPSMYTKGWVLDKNTQGVFALKKNSLLLTSSNTLHSFEPAESPMGNTFFLTIPYLVRYDNIEHVNVCTYSFKGYGVKFSSFTEFNAFLKKMGLDTIKDEHPYEKKSAETLKQDSLNAVQYAKRVAASKAYDEFLKTRMQNESPKHKDKANEQINFEIVNEQITGTGTQYVEFDINVYGNTSNTYLDNTAFVIEFNTFAFGVNLSANNLITITKGANFNAPTYEDPMTMLTDDAPNKVRFRLGTDVNVSSWNRTLLTPTQTQLVHVKMQLNTCQGFTDFVFDDIANVSAVDLYTTDPNIDPLSAPYLQYDYANYIQPSNYALCPPPAIDAFSPQVITAGTKSVLTITGHGFGATQGSSQVRFMDANTANTTIQFLDSYDYISWSDTEIKITLPYFVDSLSQDFYPGSGLFSIKKGNGDSLISPSPITVRYAVMNYRDVPFGMSGYEKIPYRHVDVTVTQNNHAREFSLDTSITNNPQMAAIVFKAMDTWTCVTGINWVVVDTVTIQDQVQDGKSVIFLTDNLFQGKQKQGFTQNFKGYPCADASTNEKFLYFYETDIAFARYDSIAIQLPMKWVFDTTMTQSIPAGYRDFYWVAMHELGHAHYLGHVRDAEDVMYYGSNSNIPASDRLHLYTSPNSMDGGTYVMTKSLTTNPSNCIGTVSVTNFKFVENCGNLGISTYQQKEDFNVITAYPNPFSESVSLQYTLSENQEISYRVCDLSGRIVYQKEKFLANEGEHVEVINLSNCAQGFYIVSMQIGKSNNSFSIVKHE